MHVIFNAYERDSELVVYGFLTGSTIGAVASIPTESVSKGTRDALPVLFNEASAWEIPLLADMRREVLEKMHTAVESAMVALSQERAA